MSIKRPDAKSIAFWRLEQIEDALVEGLNQHEHGKILRRLSKTPVRWPSGKTEPIGLSSAYRWLQLFRKGGFDALRPKQRSDLGTQRASLPDDVVQEALRKLATDPGMSFTFLLALLRPLFPKVRIPQSTLQRCLSRQPDYKRIQRLRHFTQRRTRFVAKAPHHIWQTDAKGPTRIVLASGATLIFHVLSIIDDASRAVLAAIVALHANLAAAVRVFRMAANRWGLPNRLYADRASIFDSRPFRMGLAQLGAYRIPTKARNAEARGKIEAYHRVLDLWFFKRLLHQVVIDASHLQQLLDGVIHGLYQTHKHRGIKVPPELALAGRVSERQVPPTRLVEAFQQEKRLKAHPKTGEVELHGVTYLVPDELRGRTLTFLVDPPNEIAPRVVHPSSGQTLSLRPAAIKPADLPDDQQRGESTATRWGAGNLQAIYDNWQGQRRPLAEPGFGLPEIYALLGQACGRHVPQSDAEAALVQKVYRDIGPLPHKATDDALRAITRQLGHKRPIKTYLDALAQRVQTASPKTRR